MIKNIIYLIIIIYYTLYLALNVVETCLLLLLFDNINSTNIVGYKYHHTSSL